MSQRLRRRRLTAIGEQTQHGLLVVDAGGEAPLQEREAGVQPRPRERLQEPEPALLVDVPALEQVDEEVAGIEISAWVEAAAKHADHAGLGELEIRVSRAQIPQDGLRQRLAVAAAEDFEGERNAVVPGRDPLAPQL